MRRSNLLAVSLLLTSPMSMAAAAVPDLSQMAFVRGTTTAAVQTDWFDDRVAPVVDGSSSVTRVGRASYEFAIPDLAAGGLFTNVTTTFAVVNTHGAGGLSINLQPYAGDGYADTRDTLGYAYSDRYLNVGAAGNYSHQFANLISPLPVGGSSWLGVRMWNQNGRGDIARGGAMGAAPTLAWWAAVPKSGTVTAEPAVEATAIRSGGGVFSIMSQQFDGASDRVYERSDETRRGQLEYYLAGVPTGATITSASLVFDGGSFLGASTPDVYGYAGTGSADAGGALASLRLGTGEAIADGSADQTVTLDAAAIQSLLVGGPYLGLSLRAADGGTFGYTTSDGAFDPAFPSRLVISYALVPEPATLGAVAAAGVLLQRRRRQT